MAWGNDATAARDCDQDGLLTSFESAGVRSQSCDDAFRVTAITDLDGLEWPEIFYICADQLNTPQRTTRRPTSSGDGTPIRLVPRRPIPIRTAMARTSSSRRGSRGSIAMPIPVVCCK